MSLFVCWVVFPLVLAALSAGCGLLVQRLAHASVPGALVPGVGLATIIVVAQLLTVADATAELATPVVVAMAVLGIGLSLPVRLERPALWPVVAALAAFLFFAAPVVLSGKATVVGYVKLDDTASWLALTEHVMEHGRSLAHLAPSTYDAVLHFYFDSDYPVGSLMPLGVGQKLVGQDAAWLYQPYLSVLAAMLALALYALAGSVLRSPWARTLAAVVAAQPAILYGYTLWGGGKELAAAWLLPLLAALVIPAVRAEARGRAIVAPAVVTAATLGVLSFAGAVWTAPVLLGALVCAVVWRGWRDAVRPAIRFAAVALPLSLPSLLLFNFLGGSAVADLTTQSQLANLLRPLSFFQVVGIWPAADFRLRPEDSLLTTLLIAVAVAAAGIGLAWVWRRRAWRVAVYVAAAILGCLTVAALGSPWVDAKALTIASPAVMLAAVLGAAALFAAGRTVEPALIGAALAVGVGWSNALAYQGVNLAPGDRFRELEQIGDRVAGQGPTLMTEYEPFGVRYFLRQADAEGVSELRRRSIPLRNGGEAEKGDSPDLDRLDLGGLLIYRTLVLRRSPLASRPPAPYRLVESGRYYEVWQRRPAGGPRVLSHLPLGGALEPGGTASCPAVIRLAGVARREKGYLAAVRSSPALIAPLRASSHPADWNPEVPGDTTVVPRSSGTMRVRVRLSAGGLYGVWIGGSFRGRLQVSVDGRSGGVSRHELSHAGQYVPFGRLGLAAGIHDVSLRYGGPGLHPGSGGKPEPLGPLVLSRQTADRPVFSVPLARARDLCGQRLDWIEAVKP